MVLFSNLGQVFIYVAGKMLELASEPTHLIVEAILALLILYLLFHKSYKIKDKPRLSHEVIEELLDDWTPKPLVSKEKSASVQNEYLDTEEVILSSGASPHVNIINKEGTFLNLSSLGVLNYQMNQDVLSAAEDSLRTYGVGSCGPRGFYGTIDVHLEVEDELAKFMGTESAVLYSAGFATISSVIPAFSKPGDVLIVDRGICFSAQLGITLSKSTVKWFNHNDVSDLKRNLDSIQDIFEAATKRVFVIIEGLYENHHDIAPLDEIMELKKVYPFRLIVEESLSMGVLGKRGKGITDHFNIPIKEVEIICASTGNALGSIGGFSCGTEEMCSHQRLNSSGYVFSCSLPPYISSSLIKVIELLRKGEEVNQLSENIKYLHDAKKEIQTFDVNGSEESPYLHLTLKEKSEDALEDERLLQKIVDRVREEGKIIITRKKRASKEKFPYPPSIYIAITAGHKREEIQHAVQTIENIARKVVLQK